MKLYTTTAFAAIAALAGVISMVKANSFRNGNCQPAGQFQGGDQWGNCITESEAMNCTQIEPCLNAGDDCEWELDDDGQVLHNGADCSG